MLELNSNIFSKFNDLDQCEAAAIIVQSNNMNQFKGNEAYKRETWHRISFFSTSSFSFFIFQGSCFLFGCMHLHFLKFWVFQQSAGIQMKYMTFLPSEWRNNYIVNAIRERFYSTFVSSSNNSFCIIPSVPFQFIVMTLSHSCVLPPSSRITSTRFNGSLPGYIIRSACIRTYRLFLFSSPPDSHSVVTSWELLKSNWILPFISIFRS